LTSLAELHRLMASAHIRPTWLMLGDASATWTCQMETTHGIIALVVDRRELPHACLGYRGEFSDVISLTHWDGICAWPSCTHQAVSNSSLLAIKEQDGRMFFGILGVLVAMFDGSATVRVVEQPVTTMSRYFAWPTHRLRTSAFGDTMSKTICLRMVGLELQGLIRYHRDPSGPLQARLPFWAFATEEERDEYRSSWSHFPLFLVALACCLTVAPPAEPPPTLPEAIEQFAVAWFRSGKPVPPGYDTASGLPPTAESRTYQLKHGKGDGRIIKGVIPTSLRGTPGDNVVLRPANGAPDLPDHSLVHTGALASLAAEHDLLLGALTAQGFFLLFMSVFLQPLLYVHLSGVRVIGAELPLSYSPKSVALPLMEAWADLAFGVGTAATTFLIGKYEQGPRMGVTVVPFTPPENDIVRTPAQLRRHRRPYAWCTFAALSTLAIADAAARAFAGVEAFIQPVSRLADFGSDASPAFLIGARKAVALDASPRLMLANTPAQLLLARDASNAVLLRRALLEREQLPDGHLYAGWAERIRPPDVDLQDALAALLPDFSDPTLLVQPFSTPYTPPTTLPLPRAPLQPNRRTPFCVRSHFELLTASGQTRFRSWVSKITDQLLCIENEEENCELLRPHPIALGQGAIEPWARGIVWDLTFERADCAIPLDFSLPIESNLKLPALRRRLLFHADGTERRYPDQRIVSMLLEGVRFEADVELQTVLVPHLISLPKGFASVRKELYRLQLEDWYRFYDHLPFWPMYLNGQGAACRKLSTRYRRTTECGGPRKPTFDETGLAAISINDASVTAHFPAWFKTHETEPAWADWLKAKDLQNPDRRGIATPQPAEVKPTVSDVMRDLSILLAAARQLGEPIFIFGDDARDHFNQLALSSEDWNKMGVVFVHDPARLPAMAARDRIFFVSERRLGFGAKVSSNYAQRFSEVVLVMLREDFDALEAAQPFDERPSARRWRSDRARAAEASGTPAHVQARLYCAHMYTDDAILAVVGLDRALRLLGVWQRLMEEIGLRMAPPEKRTIGTWAPWLGVLICAGLGLVIVPKEKLLRTTERLRSTLSSRTEFSEYRSLMGMLEHLRCVNCAPASVMYGLYTPHQSKYIQAQGPSSYIRITPFMAVQLERWLELLAHTGGAPVTAALTYVRSAAATMVVSSDAATDSTPPGMGGYCHGLYWYLPIEAEWLRWLHITVLELLATGGSALAFATHLYTPVVHLQSDALATPYVLTKHKTRSTNLALAHDLLLAQPAYRQVARSALIAHLFGDCNVMSDAVSRSLWKRFFALCGAMRVTPIEIATPTALVTIIEQLVAAAKLRGDMVRPTTFVRPPPKLPPMMLGLGRRSPACEEADAVAISARLLRRLNAPSQAPPADDAKARPPRHSTAPELGAMRGVSARLTAALNAPAHARHATGAQASGSSAQQPAQASALRPAATAAGKRRIDKLDTEVIAGIRLNSIPASLAKQASPRKLQKAAALTEAAHACASARASSLARAGFANTPHGLEQLTRLLQHAADLNDFGSSYSTRSIDETAWSHWESFAQVLDFNPIFSTEQVRDHQSHIGTLLATFLLFVYPKMKGKHGRQWAKPRSAFAYVLAIIRIYRGWKLLLPPAKVVKGELHGLLRAFVQVHGVAALMPRRREPFTYSMVSTMQRVNSARLGATSYNSDSPLGFAFRGILAVGWRTGHRLAEFVSHPSGELCYLTRASITYVIGGVQVTDPTREQLQQMRAGDVILIEPPRSKTDQFGEVHCPFPSAVPFNLQPNSAGFLIRQQDMDRPCRGAQRTSQPLFADAAGRPYTHSAMDALLDRMLTHCFGAGAPTRHSWHSMRIGLATALKAANVDDAVIQMICRWTNPESLRAYARHGQSLHISCVDQAEHAIIDSIQSANVPKVCNSEGNAALHLTFAPSISARAQAVLDAAEADLMDRRAVGARDAPDTPAAEAAADTSPLDPDRCVGRRVMVPAEAWPSFTCDENEGRGWTAVVQSSGRAGATVRFTDAATPRGIPYGDVTLRPDFLIPF
jgi:hypothetical protein